MLCIYIPQHYSFTMRMYLKFVRRPNCRYLKGDQQPNAHLCHSTNLMILIHV